MVYLCFQMCVHISGMLFGSEKHVGWLSGVRRHGPARAMQLRPDNASAASSCSHRDRTQFFRSAAWQLHANADALGACRLWQWGALPSRPCQDSSPEPPRCSRVSPSASLLVLPSSCIKRSPAESSFSLVRSVVEQSRCCILQWTLLPVYYLLWDACVLIPCCIISPNWVLCPQDVQQEGGLGS